VSSRWRTLDAFVIIAVVAGASLPYLIGIVTAGVLGYNSGLATISLGGMLGYHVGLPWLDPNVGFVSQALGHLSAMEILHGHIGWWNPYEGVGVPLVGEGQSAALFPLTPLLALANGQVYFHVVLEVIAAVATQRLLREMGMSRWVSLVGGIVFGLNGTFAWLTNAAFNPVAFLPVILWGVERARNRSMRDGWSGWALIAAGLALSVYAGFPETAYIDGVLAVFWVLVRFIQQPAGRRVSFAATVAVGSVIGLAVSAPFFVAFAAATSHADIGGHAGVFATAHLPTPAVSTLGLPYLFGPLSGFNASVHGTTLSALWGDVGGFVTAALVTVAMLGLLAGRDRGLRALLLAWIGVALAKSFGVGPVVSAVNHLPGISSTAFSRYAPPSWEMAFVVLAALGLERVGEGTSASVRVRTAVAVAAIASLLAIGAELLAANGMLEALDKKAGFAPYPVEAAVWALVTVLILAVVGLSARPRVARWGMGAVLVLDATIMFMVPELSAPKQIPVDLAPVTFLQEHLALSRFATLGPIVPNYGSYFGIAEVNLHDLPIPGNWANFVQHDLESNERPQQFDGVTSLKATGPTPLQELRRNLTAYESVGVKYVVAPAGWYDLPGRLVFRGRRAWIWQLPSPTSYYTVLGGSCTFTATTYDSFRASCSRPSEVVRAELDLPGWTATDNGTPLPIAASGPLFSAVRLPAGSSDVSYTYQPPHLGIATDAAMGGAGLALVMSAVPFVALRRRRGSRGKHARGARSSVGRRDGGGMNLSTGLAGSRLLSAPPPIYRPPVPPSLQTPHHQVPAPRARWSAGSTGHPPSTPDGAHSGNGNGALARNGNGNGTHSGNGNGALARNGNGNGTHSGNGALARNGNGTHSRNGNGNGNSGRPGPESAADSARGRPARRLVSRSVVT
jgi:hypothetical protein